MALNTMNHLLNIDCGQCTCMQCIPWNVGIIIIAVVLLLLSKYYLTTSYNSTYNNLSSRLFKPTTCVITCDVLVRTIEGHLSRSAVNYLLYYPSTPKASPIFYRNKDSEKPEINLTSSWWIWTKTLYGPGPVCILLYWPGPVCILLY
jgi:hypothetical protein